MPANRCPTTNPTTETMFPARGIPGGWRDHWGDPAEPLLDCSGPAYVYPLCFIPLAGTKCVARMRSFAHVPLRTASYPENQDRRPRRGTTRSDQLRSAAERRCSMSRYVRSVALDPPSSVVTIGPEHEAPGR